MLGIYQMSGKTSAGKLFIANFTVGARPLSSRLLYATHFNEFAA